MCRCSTLVLGGTEVIHLFYLYLALNRSKMVNKNCKNTILNYFWIFFLGTLGLGSTKNRGHRDPTTSVFYLIEAVSRVRVKFSWKHETIFSSPFSKQFPSLCIMQLHCVTSLSPCFLTSLLRHYRHWRQRSSSFFITNVCIWSNWALVAMISLLFCFCEREDDLEARERAWTTMEGWWSGWSPYAPHLLESCKEKSNSKGGSFLQLNHPTSCSSLQINVISILIYKLTTIYPMHGRP